MSLEEKLYTRLTSSTTITDYVGTRVYPLVAPEQVSNPYIVYSRLSGGQINTLGGYATVENPRMGIDVLSTSYTQAKSLAESVHTLVGTSTTFRAILLADEDAYDDDMALYRVSMDFGCINHE